MMLRLRYNILIVMCLMVVFNLKAQETFNCDAETYKLLKDLSDSKLAKGNILLFTTTHEDIAWLNSPEFCKIDRDKLWLTPYIDRLKSDPDFKMDIEQSSIVMEYLHRHPEEKENFINFIKEGRICIGGAYVQTYEGMYSGESLARQFYLGRKWMKDNLEGYKTNAYFNNDVPARTMQMPQLAFKAGIDNFIFARHIKGFFYWEAPDGSKVSCYSPGDHYMDFYNLLAKNDNGAVKKMATDAVDWYTLYNNKTTNNTVMPAMLNYEFIWDQKPVENCGPFINKWNKINYIEVDGKKRIKVDLPKFRYATADEFFERAKATTAIKKTIKGERPNTWVYIHGASHQKALKASREGDILMTQAEKFATANALVDGSFTKYPERELKKAWEAKIYPDHGWGGKRGQITDDLFLQKFLFAHQKGTAILNQSIKGIAGKINFKKKKGTPIVVFNSLSWERTDPVNFEINFDPNEAKGISLYTEKEVLLPIQLSNLEYYSNGFLKSAKVHFIAESVPSIGYKTFYLKPGSTKSVDLNVVTNHTFENKFYKVKLGNGGLESIFDKALGKELINTNSFKAGEIFAMHSEGNGAGEFSEVQQPDLSFFDRLATGISDWEIDEQGAVYTSYKMRQKMKEAVIEMKITFYNTTKKIDFNIDVLNWEGVLFREFRMAMPLNMNNGDVTYEVPFGAVTVGKDELKGNAGKHYSTLVKDLHPRAMENWLSASNDDYGVTLSSSVVTTDWIDPTNNKNNQIILQPILLASRKSCHHEGNEYLQTGDHHFSFSLTSHKAGWKNGQRFGKQANERLQVVLDPQSYRETILPESLSFFGTDKDNLIISTVKKAEDDHSTMIRLYDTDGIDTSASISIFKPIRKAQLTTLIEEPIKDLKIKKQQVQLKVGHNAIETLKVQ
ncbi:glycosyl hydrolase-related protein [Flavivirga spongiicola]|uniref:Glycosyl hydrolase-related protein n=1 Tax=Flavivirga spongiicola TaxID=421621 RepID=A0ABU7XQ48_9FLAO|nr:glycosyl hydrolase-related protein [Flavivirga sp. MEBiC05379]MDO5977886.1 glycoside hydrolase family 38 C-terminal domain-containing protein [Flavivirga sp. MEBiC05379]